MDGWKERKNEGGKEGRQKEGMKDGRTDERKEGWHQERKKKTENKTKTDFTKNHKSTLQPQASVAVLILIVKSSDNNGNQGPDPGQVLL